MRRVKKTPTQIFMSADNMPNTLPAELEEEFRSNHISSEAYTRAILDFCAKVYSAGLLAGLTRAKELMPEEMKENCINLERAYDPSYIEGEEWNAYRSEAIAAIEEEIRKVKGE